MHANLHRCGPRRVSTPAARFEKEFNVGLCGTFIMHFALSYSNIQHLIPACGKRSLILRYATHGGFAIASDTAGTIAVSLPVYGPK